MQAENHRDGSGKEPGLLDSPLAGDSQIHVRIDTLAADLQAYGTVQALEHLIGSQVIEIK